MSPLQFSELDAILSELQQRLDMLESMPPVPGPAGPPGPQGPQGPQGPAGALTDVEVVGSYYLPTAAAVEVARTALAKTGQTVPWDQVIRNLGL